MSSFQLGQGGFAASLPLMLPKVLTKTKTILVQVDDQRQHLQGKRNCRRLGLAGSGVTVKGERDSEFRIGAPRREGRM